MSIEHDSNFVDYYRLLDLDYRADIYQIRRAYLQKAKIHHPDTGGSEEAMQMFNTAYHTLTTQPEKQTYDRLHNFHTGTASIDEYSYDNSQSDADSDDGDIDAFLDTLLQEYSEKSVQERPSMRDWIKQQFKKE